MADIHTGLSQANMLSVTTWGTVYVQIFEGCNFGGFCSQLAIHEIFILEISLAKLWLASIGYLVILKNKNYKNTGFLTSSKFTGLENLYVPYSLKISRLGDKRNFRDKIFTDSWKTKHL